MAVEYGRPRGLYTLTSEDLEMEWFGLKGVPVTTGSLTTLFYLLTMVATPVLSSDEKGSTNSNETERYQLVVWDFHHVEVPYVICLWILLASVAKIGEFTMDVFQNSHREIARGFDTKALSQNQPTDPGHFHSKLCFCSSFSSLLNGNLLFYE